MMPAAKPQIYKGPDGSTRKRDSKDSRKESEAAARMSVASRGQISAPIVIDDAETGTVVKTAKPHDVWKESTVIIECCD